MVVLITGASRGIGYEVVQALLKRETVHQVVILTRNIDIFQGAESRIKAISCDLEKDDLAVLFGQHHIDKVDVVINNAGLLINKPFQEISLAEWRSIFQVNVFGCVKVIHQALPLLLKSDYKQVINISSMGGVQGSVKFPGLSAYSASKAALNNLTECLAEEYKDQGLHINSLALGAVQTEMLEEAFPGYQAPIQPSEMAQFIVDFIFTNGRFFNGKILPISSTTP